MKCGVDYNFYAVMEQTSPEDAKIEILSEEKGTNGDLHFLRYRQCLQSFGHRNRNKRLWLASHIRESLANPWIQQYFKTKGGFPGENGHPVSGPDGGKVRIERLATIDPNNICILLKDYEFQGDELLFGTVETIDDGNGPGNRLMRNILQGMEPAVSCRSLVPQKKNPDGTIDVIGAGRLICYDRVFVPSHEEAFRDESVEITNVVKKTNLSPAYEALIEDSDLTAYATGNSDSAKFILDGLTPVMESAALDFKRDMLSIDTNEGRLFIPLNSNKKVKGAIRDFMMK